MVISVVGYAQEFGQRTGFRGIVAKKEKPIELNESDASQRNLHRRPTITILTAKRFRTARGEYQ